MSEGVLAYFELAMWNALVMMLCVPVHACAFHWAKAAQRNFQKHGLEAAARNDMGHWGW